MSISDRAAVEMRLEIKRLEADLDYANETILDLLNQSIGEYDKDLQQYTYDHMCLSTYESALDFAVKQGIIKKEQVTR